MSADTLLPFPVFGAAALKSLQVGRRNIRLGRAHAGVFLKTLEQLDQLVAAQAEFQQETEGVRADVHGDPTLLAGDRA